MKSMLSVVTGTWKVVCIMCLSLTVFSIVPSFAAADYSASVPCPPGDPVLTPNESIIRTKGQNDTKEFEIKEANGDVNVIVKEWRIGGQDVTKSSMSKWGSFELSNNNKIMRWTLGGDATGEFQLSALVRRGCGNGGEAEDEVLSLWQGEIAEGVHIAALKFTSDHDKLRNNAYDHYGIGQLFSEMEGGNIGEYIPEGEPMAHNYPISHTWNSKISIELLISADEDGPSGSVDISGIGLGNYEIKNVTLPSPGNTKSISITSSNVFIGN